MRLRSFECLEGLSLGLGLGLGLRLLDDALHWLRVGISSLQWATTDNILGISGGVTGGLLRGATRMVEQVWDLVEIWLSWWHIEID